MASVAASRQPGSRAAVWAGVLCAIAGVALFQFFGNANRGYIDTSSLWWWWIYQWINPASETEHGWLILAVSAWLFGRNLRDQSRRSENLRVDPADSRDAATSRLVDRSTAAAAALLVALALHAVGFVGQQARLSIIALLLFAWGVLRLTGGRRWGAAAVFPLGFLVFAIPVNVLDSLGFWLRLWVIDASAGLAHAGGIGVVRSGTQLLAPDGRYQYDVAAACSGVRSLTALAALSLLVGYLFFRTWRRRTLVFLLCFPLVYIGNVARIVAIIFAAQLGGPVWGDRAHAVMGWGVFAIVLGGVWLGVRALERWWPERDAGGTREREPDESRERRRTPSPVVVASIVALATTGEMVFLHSVAARPVRGGAGVVLAANGRDPVELPAFIGTEWAGKRVDVSPVERDILPPDTGYSRKYYLSLSQSGPGVFLSVVLSGRDRTSIHRPELCLLGQGWTLLDQHEHRFRLPNASGAVAEFPATVLRVQREIQTPRGRQTHPEIVAYWFVGDDTVVATHWRRLALDAWNRIAHGRADRWAYVLLQTDAAEGEAAALSRMQSVLDGTLPVILPPSAPR
jgi:EpsI family protein